MQTTVLVVERVSPTLERLVPVENAEDVIVVKVLPDLLHARQLLILRGVEEIIILAISTTFSLLVALAAAGVSGH